MRKTRGRRLRGARSRRVENLPPEVPDHALARIPAARSSKRRPRPVAKASTTLPPLPLPTAAQHQRSRPR